MDKEQIKLMSFDEALEYANKLGYPIARKGMINKCVFFQIPATIREDIVPKMTSLSEKVKELILATAKKISYNNQAIIYDCVTGQATYYVPTIEDCLATDWGLVKYETSNK